MASLEWLSPDLVINADSFNDEGVLAGASFSPRYARRRLGSWLRRCRSFRRPSAPTPRGSWADQWEPRLAYVSEIGPGPDEVTGGIRAQGARPDCPAAQATPSV